MKAVQENKRFSKVAEDAFRQYLRLSKERSVEESTMTKKTISKLFAWVDKKEGMLHLGPILTAQVSAIHRIVALWFND